MKIIFTLLLLFYLDETPPGTIKIKDYYVDRTEIQSIHWLEYIYYKKQELDSIEIRRVFPDSSNFWYSLPDYKYKPIVLVTYEQVLEYCAWRSKVVNERFGKKVTYRLPTATEWKDIAEEVIRIDQKQIERDLKETQQMMKMVSGQYILIQMENPKPRVYNMFDNVTEMTIEKGIAMGSNNSDLSNLNKNLTRLIKYTSSNSYLGFRCVAEVE